MVSDDEIIGAKHDGNDTLLSLDGLLKDLRSHIAMFLLHMQEKHVPSRVVQQTAVGEIQFLFTTFITHYSPLIQFH